MADRITRAQRAAIGDAAVKAQSTSRKPTQAQKDKIAELRRVFGNATIRSHAPHHATGHVRLELTADAGTWNWTLDAHGEIVYVCFEQTLWNRGDGAN